MELASSASDLVTLNKPSLVLQAPATAGGEAAGSTEGGGAGGGIVGGKVNKLDRKSVV